MTVGQEAKVIIEHAATMEEGQCEAKDGLEPLLEIVHPGPLFIGQLLVDVVFPEREA